MKKYITPELSMKQAMQLEPILLMETSGMVDFDGVENED